MHHGGAMAMHHGGGHREGVYHHAGHHKSTARHAEYGIPAPSQLSAAAKHRRPLTCHAKPHEQASSQLTRTQRHRPPVLRDQSPIGSPPPRPVQIRREKIDRNHCEEQMNVHQTIMRSMPTRSAAHERAVREMQRQVKARERNCSEIYCALRAKVRSLIEQTLAVDDARLPSHPSTSTKSKESNDLQADSFVLAEKSLPPEAERLRGFCSHILSIDYDARRYCPDPLLKADWIHYTRLARVAFETFTAHHPPSQSSTILLDWSDKCCRHPEVDQYIVCPALVLGIKTRVVVSLLCSFIYRHGFWTARGLRRYCRIEFDYGAVLVAHKLTQDHDGLLEKLCPKDAPNYLRWIKQGNEQQQRIYFDYLKSPLDFGVKEWFAERLGSYGVVGWCIGKEPEVMQKRFKRIEYMKAAMEGFPEEPNCSWRKRHVVAWRGRCCARKLFG